MQDKNRDYVHKYTIILTENKGRFFNMIRHSKNEKLKNLFNFR